MSYYLTISGLILIAAAVFGAVVARTSRIRRATRYLLPLGVVGVTLLIVGANSRQSVLTSVERSALEQDGNQLVDRIEAFRDQSGRLPRDLSELRPAAPVTRYGPFVYSRESDSTTYSVQLGDIDQDRFKLVWSSQTPRGKWQCWCGYASGS